MKLFTPPRALLLLAAPLPVPPSDNFLDCVRDELDEACHHFDDLDEDEKVDVYKLLGWYVCFREARPGWSRMRVYFQG